MIVLVDWLDWMRILVVARGSVRDAHHQCNLYSSSTVLQQYSIVQAVRIRVRRSPSCGCARRLRYHIIMIQYRNAGRTYYLIYQNFFENRFLRGIQPHPPHAWFETWVRDQNRNWYLTRD